MVRTVLAIALLGPAACASVPAPPPVATFSIVARDSDTGDLGVAVQSRFLGVGAVVPWARAGVGAVATQAWANTRWGPEGLRLLEAGKSPEEAIGILTAADPGRRSRQVGIVDARGRSAAFTGEKAQDWAGHVTGPGYACQGNILAGKEVVAEMARAFRGSEAPLPERLVAALRAGQAAGGDRRGRQSAALLVVRRQGGYSGFNDRYVDLRVEDHERPIEELARLLALHRKTFGRPPVPGAADRFEREPEPEGDPLSSPRAAWETWVRRFRARDWKALHAVYSTAYRKENPLPDFKERLAANAGSIESFLEDARYAGTAIDGDRAKVRLATPRAPRPLVQEMVREDGEWRFAD